jgi:hypothetical protein
MPEAATLDPLIGQRGTLGYQDDGNPKNNNSRKIRIYKQPKAPSWSRKGSPKGLKVVKHGVP